MSEETNTMDALYDVPSVAASTSVKENDADANSPDTTMTPTEAGKQASLSSAPIPTLPSKSIDINLNEKKMINVIDDVDDDDSVSKMSFQETGSLFSQQQQHQQTGAGFPFIEDHFKLEGWFQSRIDYYLNFQSCT